MYRFFLLLGASCQLFSSSLDACLYPDETPVAKYLKPIEINEAPSGLESVDCIYIVNLDTRPEKWQRMKAIVEEQGLYVNRVSGIKGWEIPKEVQEELAGNYVRRLRSGQVGCLLSHLSVMKDAYERGFNRIWLLEDDVEFKEDIRQIPLLLAKLTEIDPEWDVFYTDIDSKVSSGERAPSLTSDFRPDRQYHPLDYYTNRFLVERDIMKIGQRFGTYSMFISGKGLKKILDYFTHIYLWTSIDVDMHYVPDIREYSAVRDIVTVCTEIPISDTEGID